MKGPRIWQMWAQYIWYRLFLGISSSLCFLHLEHSPHPRVSCWARHCLKGPQSWTCSSDVSLKSSAVISTIGPESLHRTTNPAGPKGTGHSFPDPISVPGTFVLPAAPARPSPPTSHLSPGPGPRFCCHVSLEHPLSALQLPSVTCHRAPPPLTCAAGRAAKTSPCLLPDPPPSSH